MMKDKDLANFLKNKVKEAKVVEVEVEPSEDSTEEEAMAEELISAIQSKDASGVVQAIKALMMKCGRDED